MPRKKLSPVERAVRAWQRCPGAADAPVLRSERRYMFLSACPFRTDEEEAEMSRLREDLIQAGFSGIPEPCPREGA